MGTAGRERHDVVQLRRVVPDLAGVLPGRRHAAQLAAPLVPGEHLPLVDLLELDTVSLCPAAVSAAAPCAVLGLQLAGVRAVQAAQVAVGRLKNRLAPAARAGRSVAGSDLLAHVVDAVPALVAAYQLRRASRGERLGAVRVGTAAKLVHGPGRRFALTRLALLAAGLLPRRPGCELFAAAWVDTYPLLAHSNGRRRPVGRANTAINAPDARTPSPANQVTERACAISARQPSILVVSHLDPL